VKRAVPALALAVGLSLSLSADAEKPKTEVKLGGSSSAVTPEILDAIAAEMDRAMTGLKVPRQASPYHISYKITEVDVNDVVSSLGFATLEKNSRFVAVEARVRVGSVDRDNANFVIPGGETVDGVAGSALPLEATPEMAARAAWRVTDEAYKEALVQLRYKNDARASGGGGSKEPGWSDVKPVVAEDPVLVPELEPLDALVKRANALSEKFRDRDLRDSRVALTSYLERRWYISSDGTRVHDTRRVSGVLMVAVGQADDGQDVAQYYTRYGHTAADLPEDKELIAAADKLADTVDALRKAPAMGRYTGPVLFEGEGAAGIVRYTLAPHLGGTPLPEGLRPQEAKQFGGALNDKVGLKVISGNLTIVDDPTTDKAAGKALIGGYKIDDEGVAAQKVEVVKNGMLKALLMSRTPAKKGDVSNGHARRTAPGGMFHGTATNLILSGKGGLDRKKLVARLLAEAKGNGLDYGVIVKQMDDAAITSQPEMTRRELLAMFQNTDTDLPPPALLVYKVYPGGKEELVRTAQVGEVPIRAWKDLMAFGKNPTVLNFLAIGDGYVIQKINGTAEGKVPSSGIESAVVTPDLLFKELEIVPYTVGQRATPAIPRPDVK
jgi:predicted Zn-dependent protease